MNYRALLFVALTLGCSSAAPACPEGTFDCLGACLPLGSTCGGSDAGARDAPALEGLDGGTASDAFTPRDAPSVGSCTSPDGIPVLRYCRTAGITRDCRDNAEVTCRADEHCEETSLRDGSGHFAACFAEGSTPCNLTVDAPVACDGAVITYCEARGPLDSTRRVDCQAALGWEGATCVADGAGFTCIAPEATPCDMARADTCDGDRIVTCSRSSSAGPVLTRRDCGAGLRCEESRIDARGICIGIDARTAERPPSSTVRAERCLDETTVEIEREGFIYSSPCPVTRHLGGDGMSVQTVCTVDGVGRYACVDPPLIPCTDEASVCVDGASGGGSAARTCVDQGDGRRVLVDRACSATTPMGSVGTDCTAGTCAYVGACTAADAPTCIGHYRFSCQEGRWSAESCAVGCTSGACIP